jgi:tripartite-type tricarboxylate transporter receptor subunit TctC
MQKSFITLPLAAFASIDGMAWPDEPVTLVVPFPPDGSSDLIARTQSIKMGEKLEAGATDTICASRARSVPMVVSQSRH